MHRCEQHANNKKQPSGFWPIAGGENQHMIAPEMHRFLLNERAVPGHPAAECRRQEVDRLPRCRVFVITNRSFGQSPLAAKRATLRDIGVGRGDFPGIAAKAMTDVWTACTRRKSRRPETSGPFSRWHREAASAPFQ